MGGLFSLKPPRTCGCSGYHNYLSGHRLETDNSKNYTGYYKGSGKNEEQRIFNLENITNKNMITVLAAKEIITMNPSWPIAKYVVVQNGRILSVANSLVELTPWIGEVPKGHTSEGSKNSRFFNKTSNVHIFIDYTFKDHVLVPGFIEPHMHTLLGGVAMSIPCLAYEDWPNPYDSAKNHKGCKSRADAITKLRAVVAEREQFSTGEKSVIFAWGWDSLACGGHLSRDDLDKVSEKYPIFVWDRSMHLAFTNSKMLELAKLTVENSGHKNGVAVYQRFNPVTGKEESALKGQFIGIGALGLLKSTITPIFGHVRNMLEAMRYSVELARQGGITTHGELLLGPLNVILEENIFDAFFNDDGCPMRCCAVISATDLKKLYGSAITQKFLVENSLMNNFFLRPLSRLLFVALDRICTNYAIKHIASMQRLSTEKLIYNNGVKFILDDSYLNLTMQMGNPGYTDSVQRGIWNTPPDRLVQELYPFWKAGCRIHIHSNGDAANDLLCKALHILHERHPRFDHRFCVEHFGQANLSIIRRLKQLNASVSVNPYYHHDRARINEQLLGFDRAHTASCFKTIIDNGLVCAMHSDAPVGVPTPLKMMWIACERKLRIDDTEIYNITSDNRYVDDAKGIASEQSSEGRHSECISPYKALRMITVDAAYVLGLDDLIGSIEPGKLADFTVLEKSPLEPTSTENPRNLKDIRIWGTVLGGKLYPLKKSDGKTKKLFNLSYMDQVPEPAHSDKIYSVSEKETNLSSPTCSFIQSAVWLFCYTYDSYDFAVSGTSTCFNKFVRRLVLFAAKHIFKVPNIIRRKPAESSRSIVQRNIRMKSLAKDNFRLGYFFLLSMLILLVSVIANKILVYLTICCS